MMVLLLSFTGFENCFVHLSKNNNLELKFMESVKIDQGYDFVYISCLNKKDTFVIIKNKELFNYLKFCIKNEGNFNKALFEITFYKQIESANNKFELNKLADKLFYKNYENFFHYYDYNKVEFFRYIIRYKLAKLYYQNNEISKALRILKNLEEASDFRIKFIALNLKNEIYQKLNYKTNSFSIEVSISDGIYVKGMDTTIAFENLKIYKKPLICELDFPEIYIVKDKKLILWDSPIIH